MEQARTRTGEPSNATLVEFAGRGDTETWRQLVHRFSPLVWAVARTQGLDRIDAADVYQTTWLVATTRNEAIRMGRHAARERPAVDHAVDEPAADRDTPEVALLLDEERRGVLRAYTQLSERCQRVLAASPATSYEQVAEQLGMPVGSLGPTRGCCLRHLRQLLEGDEDDH